jgi:hypothetical protein
MPLCNPLVLLYRDRDHPAASRGDRFMPALPLSQVAVHLRPDDNVAVAARPLPAGTQFQFHGDSLSLSQRIGLGHKIALRRIKKGEAIRKYGQIIGFASEDIPPGALVHVHNVSADAFERDYAFCRDCPPPPPRPEPRYWMGYDRGDGRYGTRNYIAIISTVNCSASTSKYISERFRRTDLLKQFPNVDGVVAITHKAGCAMQYDGADHNQLDRTLAGFAKHPNVAAYILVGLGCETGQAIHLIEHQGLIQLPPTPTLPHQGGGRSDRRVTCDCPSRRRGLRGHGPARLLGLDLSGAAGFDSHRITPATCVSPSLPSPACGGGWGGAVGMFSGIKKGPRRP